MDGFAKASMLQYCLTLVAALRRFEGVDLGQSLQIKDFCRGLRRGGAMRPKTQATPATLEEIRKVLRREACPLIRLAVHLCWLGAARASDVLRLSTDDLALRNDGTWCFNWITTKADPFKLGRQTGLTLPPPTHSTLLERTQQATAPRNVFPASIRSTHITRALRRVNPQLSSHSIRRGASHHLNALGLPLEDIQKVTRHANLESLIRYLPKSGSQRVAETAKTSKHLQ
eukprot:TRINITY_DN19856_c0_g1_i2.p5 TRINITY_DN19856_c0_g1~~TRINITY_DN19856_c0_g1_i2.p5  ORF type:complete len:229 (-),score=39.85 TRINITY_DN19856_c0_g1_i2:1199-1885(-)